jgi:hypothetical protein
MLATLQSCRALGRSRESPGFTFFGCRRAEENTAGRVKRAMTSPGVSYFALFRRYSSSFPQRDRRINPDRTQGGH